MRRVHLLPNAITLANAFCGLLALAKAIDALTLSGDDPIVFYRKMETACFLVFLGMMFDSADGLVARMVKANSDFGAQLDSFSDALTFGVAPAMLAKVLIEHESTYGNARLNFLAAATFALLAILRLVRFNLQAAPESKNRFRGLPSPAAAGSVAGTIWLYLVLKRPELEASDGTPTPTRSALEWMNEFDWSAYLGYVPALLALLLPILGLLMISNVTYLHPFAFMGTGERSQFTVLVGFVFVMFLLYLAPVAFLFALFNGFVASGLVLTVFRHVRRRYRRRAAAP